MFFFLNIKYYVLYIEEIDNFLMESGHLRQDFGG